MKKTVRQKSTFSIFPTALGLRQHVYPTNRPSLHRRLYKGEIPLGDAPLLKVLVVI